MAFKPIANTRSATGVSTGKLALYWLLCSEIVIFGGALAGFMMHKFAHPEWAFQAVHTNTLAGSVNTFILLTSSLFAVLAHDAAEMKDGKKAAKWLLATVAGGVLFLCVKGVEWSLEISHGYTITSSTFWSFYYTVAGIHASHVIAGCIIMLFLAKDAWQGKELHRVEFIGLYWHFVDIIWIFLFPLLYIAK